MNDSLRVGDDGSDGADGSQQKLYFSSCEFEKQRLCSCKAEIMMKNICKSWRKSSEKNGFSLWTRLNRKVQMWKHFAINKISHYNFIFKN